MLTPREIQIIVCLKDGLSDKAIANRLGIAISTVKNHMHTIHVKLGVETRLQIILKVQG